MIEIILEDKVKQIRTSWNDVTYSGYVEMLKNLDKSWMKRLSIYTGIGEDVLNKMTINQICLFIETVGFMESLETVDAFTIGYESDVQVSEMEYWKLEKAKQLLKESNGYIVGAEIVDLYTSDKDGNGGTNINDMPVTQAIGIVAFFLHNYQSSLIGSKD